MPPRQGPDSGVRYATQEGDMPAAWLQPEQIAAHLRFVFALVLQHHVYRALANFGGKVGGLLHGSIFSKLGASSKPGAVHIASTTASDLSPSSPLAMSLLGKPAIATLCSSRR